jgi:hypothetical protein
MPADNEFQQNWGTALATFTQTGTYSAAVQLSRRIAGVYSENWPSAAGSVVFRASVNPSGSGHAAVQTNDGTVLKVLAFGSGTYYSFNNLQSPVPLMPVVVLQIGTAGTAAVAAGGTIVLVTGP